MFAVKKLLSCFLALLLLFTLCIPAFAADEDTASGLYLPTIYILGRNDTIYANYGTPDQKVVWNGRVPVPDGLIADMAKELLPLFLKALLRNDYKEWAEKFSEHFAKIYKDIVLDKKAQPQPGSINSWQIPDNPGDHRAADGTYGLWEYSFRYDWRLDPLQIAERLNKYIEGVLAATGAKKVNLAARCEGGSILLAYLYRFGPDKIAGAMTIGSSMNGCMEISDLFSGDVDIRSDAVNRFITRYIGSDDYKGIQSEYFDDPVVIEYLKATVALLATSGSLELPIHQALKLFDKVKAEVYPGLLMSSYGTFPGYWAMVDDAHYETAKSLAGLTDNAEWADFVSVIDTYHYEVFNHCAEILHSCVDQGMYFTNLVKYGMDAIPVFGEGNKINDRVVTAEQASMGATCARVNETLPADRIAAVDKKYISPDKQIDASTCAFPETTWFFKYCDHSYWGDACQDWMYAVLRSGGTLTADDPVWQRFMVYDYKTHTAEPMTEENADKFATNEITSPFEAFLVQLRTFFGTLKFYVQLLAERLRSKS